MSWNVNVETPRDGVRKYRISDGTKNLTYENVIYAWRESDEFCRYFISILHDSPFPAYFWETPPITTSTIDREFEFVLVDSPTLNRIHPNSNAFEKKFNSTSESILSFHNLGRDAMLVVPKLITASADYSSLAKYVRSEEVDQQIRLWNKVGSVILSELGDEKMWVSTSGLGVYWLHIRLDSRPKYYTYRLYREERGEV